MPTCAARHRQGVKRKGDDGAAEDTVGITHHRFGPDGKIEDIWFLRQLTGDESRKVTVA